MAKSKIGDLASAVHVAAEAAPRLRTRTGQARVHRPPGLGGRSKVSPRDQIRAEEDPRKRIYATREGFRGVVCYLPEEIWAALRHHSIDERSTMQAITYTALSEYMTKRKIKPDEPRR